MISCVLSNGCPLHSEVNTASAFTMAWQNSSSDQPVALDSSITTPTSQFPPLHHHSNLSRGATAPRFVSVADIVNTHYKVMAPTNITRCHFTSMCAELRIRVYRYLFEDATALVRNVHDFKTCDLLGARLWSTGCNKSILSTCRIVHAESKPILAGSMLLIIWSSWWKAQDSFKVYYLFIDSRFTSVVPL